MKPSIKGFTTGQPHPTTDRCVCTDVRRRRRLPFITLRNKGSSICGDDSESCPEPPECHGRHQLQRQAEQDHGCNRTVIKHTHDGASYEPHDAIDTVKRTECAAAL